MNDASPAVDRYIENAAPFAQPILQRIRRAFHAADPDVVETIKWGFPHFEHDGILGGMAAFKQHVNFGLWKAELIAGAPAMGEPKLTDVAELPPEKELIAHIRAAVRLNVDGVKIARPKKAPQAEPTVPGEFAAALDAERSVRGLFDALPPSHRREYVEWIAEAKQPATRAKRIATALEWIREGKQRNWKYMKKP
jgi:hypothetical protein